jgi:tripartite-type tricarboxylate transporter receptor subunit TctC
VAKLSQALQSASYEADVRAKLQAQGIVPRTVGLSEFDAYMKTDMDRLAPIIKAAGVTAN